MDPAKRAAILSAERRAVHNEETHGWHAHPEKGLKLRFTAAQLLATELPPPRFAIDGIVPEGLTVFAGAPKLGKSWFALATALAVATGGAALGSIRVEQGDVLYLALEDNLRRLQDRTRKLHDAGEPAAERLQLSVSWPRLDEDRALGWLEHWADDVENPRLLIVDTLARVRAHSRANTQLYEVDYRALEGLKRFADDRHIAVIVVHHTRKATADDPIYEVSGSTGLTGAADAVLVLRRERGKANAVLSITGRDVEERELALRFDSSRFVWELLGEADAVRRSSERSEVLELLAERSMLTPKAVAEALGRGYEGTKKLLQRMFSDGELTNDGSGRYSRAALEPLALTSLESPSGTGGNSGTCPDEQEVRDAR
jgi:hypothetical protein